MKSNLAIVASLLVAAAFGWFVGPFIFGAPERHKPEHRQSSLPPLESLMPKFEVRETTNAAFQVWFMSHESTHWVYAAELPTRESAEATVAATKAELKMKYDIGKEISDAFRAAAP